MDGALLRPVETLGLLGLSVKVVKEENTFKKEENTYKTYKKRERR